MKLFPEKAWNSFCNPDPFKYMYIAWTRFLLQFSSILRPRGMELLPWEMYSSWKSCCHMEKIKSKDWPHEEAAFFVSENLHLEGSRTVKLRFNFPPCIHLSCPVSFIWRNQALPIANSSYSKAPSSPIILRSPVQMYLHPMYSNKINAISFKTVSIHISPSQLNFWKKAITFQSFYFW